MKSIVFGLLFFSLHTVLFAVPLSVDVTAESAILINADSGAILFEKNPHKLCYPASTTKIATAAYTLRVAPNKLENMVAAEHDAIATVTEEARKRSKYTVPAYWLVPGGSHIGIKKGEELSLKDLLYGMMVSSGNDAANVIAQYVGGTIPNFMEGLNGYLKKIGCKKTKFYNPHGLYHPKHQTTAYDLALMLQDAIKIPQFKEMIETTSYTRPKTNKQESSILVQTNKLIRKGKHYYAKAIGGKTGYLSNAGHTLVVAAKQDDRVLIAVLLKCNNRDDLFSEATKLFESAFNQSKVQRTLLKAGPQDKIVLEMPGAKKPIATYLKQDVNMEYYPAEEPTLKCLFTWKVSQVPIAKDQQIGELNLQTGEGVTLQVVPVYAAEDVSATWLWSLKNLVR